MPYSITGARGNIEDPREFMKKAGAFMAKLALPAQLVDSRFVIDNVHVALAYRQALRRVQGGSPISRSLAMEFLLYLAGTHQIDVAIRRVGVRTGTTHMLVICMDGGDEEKVLELLTALQLEREMEPVYSRDIASVLEAFGIPPAVADGSESELARKAVYEAVCLVNLER